MSMFRIGTKNNWRRWVWNRVRERFTRVDDALVLYLAGHEDLDREVAVSKGFRNENLIAVDDNPKVVKAIRAKGFLAIQHDLAELVFMWPEDWPLTFVLADFCSGFIDSSWVFAEACVSSKALVRGSVVAVNFQRGREPELLEQFGEHRHLLPTDLEKNRAYYWAMALAGHYAVAYNRSDPNPYLAKMNFQPRSYRSHRVVMDSAVITVPDSCARNWANIPRDWLDAKRKISACRAVRTWRLRQHGRVGN